MLPLTRILFILLFLGLIPLSCRKDCGRCECDDFSHIKDFRITNMEIKTINAFGQRIDTTNFHQQDSLFKSIFVKEKVDVALNLSKPSEFNLFTPGLYACSPPEPVSTNKISDVSIISSKEQAISNLRLSKGDTINHLFNITQDAYFITKRYYQTFEDFEGYLDNENNLWEFEEVIIKTIAEINNPTIIEFDIQIDLNDGSSFAFTNEILKIRN